jgi:glycosyltransferase involved in cell wall biosynthesis
VRTSIGITVQSYSSFLSTTPVLLARGLSELGYDVDVLTTHALDARASPYPRGEAADAGSITLTHFPYAGIVRDNVLIWPTSKPFPPNYDCLIVHEDYPLLSHHAARWAIRHGVPVILVTERYYYPPDRLTEGLLRVEDRLAGRFLWRNATLGVFHTRASQQFVSELGHYPREGVVIPGVIDALYFQEASLRSSKSEEGKDKSKTEILTVARLHPYKGLVTLIDAMALLRARGVNAHLRVIGRGQQEHILRTLISERRLSQAITLDTRPIPNHEMPQEYLSADVYVQPSLREPFGSAVVEAMACGLPVVASATGGLADTVSDGETGYLVPPDQPGAFADRIQALATNSDTAILMGEAGRSRAVNNFDYRTVARTYQRKIEAILH